ncbi:MAG TPA: M48 family metallopeptidase [Bdellovibrionales bacterium]|nr:M48 family metallopeptidase [Bdellovibrionales bacterium]
MKRLLLVLIFATACSTSPTGRKQLLLMPEDNMNHMGAQAFQQMKGQTPADSDPKTNAYVKCVANALTKEIESQSSVKEWEVVVFRDNTANAFALPGGKIGVHTGLLKVAKTPDQLAAVIGHEIGHVTAQHGNERVSQAMGAQLGLAAIDVALQNKQNPNRRTILAALGIGAQFGVLMPFGRTQESEADVIGLEIMSNAGFNPEESIQLWRNMSSAGGGQPPEWLSTHPSHETRISNLQSKMGEMMPRYRNAQAAGKRPNCAAP